MISMRNKKNCPSVIVKYLLLSRALSGQLKSVSGAMKVQCYSRQVNVPFHAVPIIYHIMAFYKNCLSEMIHLRATLYLSIVITYNSILLASFRGFTL